VFVYITQVGHIFVHGGQTLGSKFLFVSSPNIDRF